MRNLPGARLALSLPRRLLTDYLHFARQVPSVPVQRTFQLGEVVQARAESSPRPGWCSLFTKAYSLLCAQMPVLRRCYRSFPWPHLYEHPQPVASVAVERAYADEQAVFFTQIREPHRLALVDLDTKLRRFKEAPEESLAAIRRQLRICRLPTSLRRLGWWIVLNTWGRKRAHYLGTYGVSVYSSLGAASLHPLSVLTSTLTYDVFRPDGSVDVRLVYDHRVTDGATIARALSDLESILRHEILAELRYLSVVEAA